MSLPGLMEHLWLYDSELVEERVAGKQQQPVWRHVAAALRLLDAAERTGRMQPLRLAALDCLAQARSAAGLLSGALPDGADLEEQDLEPADAARRMKADVGWLTDALAGCDDPPDTELEEVLDRLIGDLLVVVLQHMSAARALGRGGTR